MKRLLIKLGFRIGDPFDWEPTPWVRLRLWSRRFKRRANSTCNACGYRGVRTRKYRWCPACHEDLGGELIRDQKPDSLDAGPLGSGHSPSATGREVGDSGGSVEEPSTHLIHGPASTQQSADS